MPGFPLGIHIPNFPQPPLALGLMQSTGFQSFFARINMLIQFFVYRAEKWTQLKADGPPSGRELTRGSSEGKNKVAREGFCNYPQVLFISSFSSVFMYLFGSNFKLPENLQEESRELAYNLVNDS